MKDDITIIIMDSMIPSIISPYGGQYHLPNFERWTSENTLFSKCVTSCTATNGAMTSMLTGLSAANHNVRMRGNYLYNHIPSIADICRKVGFRVGYFSERFIAMPFGNPEERFDVVYDSGRSFDHTSHEVAVPAVIEKYREFRRGSTPTLAILYFIVTHSPWLVQEKSLSEAEFFDRYSYLMGWVDTHIFGELLGDPGTIIVVSDHGDVIDPANISATAHASVIDNCALMAVLAMSGDARVDTSLRSNCDIAPTVCDLVDVHLPSDGISLFDTVFPRYAYTYAYRYHVLMDDLYRIVYDHHERDITITDHDCTVVDISMSDSHIVEILEWWYGMSFTRKYADVWKSIFLDGCMYQLTFDMRFRTPVLNDRVGLGDTHE